MLGYRTFYTNLSFKMSKIWVYAHRLVSLRPSLRACCFVEEIATSRCHLSITIHAVEVWPSHLPSYHSTFTLFFILAFFLFSFCLKSYHSLVYTFPDSLFHIEVVWLNSFHWAKDFRNSHLSLLFSIVFISKLLYVCFVERWLWCCHPHDLWCWFISS